ncbi:unnamed protein product, partial [Mesorhabditis belari]|uniref:C2H2-type domain-containing protein n=1 Tax=Mesorhabditis belari TaxID=2138241 RepID=A0AAF3EFT0_9BILA
MMQNGAFSTVATDGLPASTALQWAQFQSSNLVAEVQAQQNRDNGSGSTVVESAESAIDRQLRVLMSGAAASVSQMTNPTSRKRSQNGNVQRGEWMGRTVDSPKDPPRPLEPVLGALFFKNFTQPYAHCENSLRSLTHNESEMSVDEHLSSIPSPQHWIDQFRYTQDLAMLGGMAVGGVGKDPYKLGGGQQNGGVNGQQQGVTSMIVSNTSNGQPQGTTSVGGLPPCPQQIIINSDFLRCEENGGRVGGGVRGGSSSGGPSSSSCSPSSSDHNHHILRHTSSTDSTLDVVNSMINNAQLKTEPLEAAYGLPSLIGMPMHLNPYQNARNSIDAPRSSTGNPASVQGRRTRSSTDGMFKCQFCPKKWTDESLLQQHMGDCRMVRVHECAQCGKRFKARGGLQQHMRSRIHSNDRPYACQFCAKRFTQKSHVDQHERIHTGVKPFICQFCGRAFRQRSQQMGHEATHQHSGSRGHRRNTNDDEGHRQQQSVSLQQQQSHQQVQVQQQPQQNQQLDSVSALDSMLHQSLPSMVQQQTNGLQLAQQNTSPPTSSGPLAAPPLNNLFGFPANCANNAMSSLLALSQNMCPPQPGAYGGNMNNMALGIINSIQ